MFWRIQKVMLHSGFEPGLKGVLFNPFYLARHGLWRYIASYGLVMKGRMLDVGCGTKPYQKLFHVDHYIGLEIEGRRQNAEHEYDGHVFPFVNDEFHGVFCSQVLEHVPDPNLVLSEIYRVLKPGGYCILTTPFVWEEHEQPHDYCRFTHFGLYAVLRKTGFEIIKADRIGTPGETFFQMLNAFADRFIRKRGVIMQLFFRLSVTTPLNLLGALVRRYAKTGGTVYLDNIFLVQKPSS